MTLTILTVPDRPERFNSFIYNIPKLEEKQVIIAFTDLDDATRIERIFDVNKYGDGRITYSKIHKYHEKDFPMVKRIKRAEHANKRAEEELFEAVRSQSSYIARRILKTHISPDCKNEHAQTPLMIAARNGYSLSTEFILQAGADINAQDHHGWTALMMAARYGHDKIVKRLLDAGANPDIQMKNNWTALMNAARNNHTEIVKLLLNAGADHTLLNGHKHNALYIANISDNEDCVDVLSQFEPKAPPSANSFVFFAWLGNEKQVQRHLNAKLNPNQLDERGWSPMIAAARFGHTEIVKKLLDVGAAPDLLSRGDGWTPLLMAARYGHTDIVKLLLEHKVNINAKMDEDWTPLIAAARYGYTDIVKLLLDAKADITIENNECATALDLATKYKHTDIEKLLSGA